MPGLKAFLQKTMIFTAAAPNNLFASWLPASEPIVPTPPTATTQGDEADRPIWNWTHDPNSPAKITNLAAIVRAMNNMTMTACDSIEVERVAISLSPNSPVLLPLDVDHVVCKFKLEKGHIPNSLDGWWRLESNVDWSMAVVFAYEIVRSLQMPEPTPKILKVKLADLEEDSAFPAPGVRSGDPDYMDPTAVTRPSAAGVYDGAARTLENTVTAVGTRHFVVVVFGLTTCKERGDFEPGGVLGAGRVYPHVMVLSSQGMVNAEATIHIKRPASGMKNAEMDGRILPLLATDSNVMHGPTPIWSNVFDYVVTNPFDKIGLIDQDDRDGSGSGWMTVVDPTKKQRTIVGKIKRETLTHIPHLVEPADFTKMDMQGEFDSIHLAPSMIYEPLIGPKETFIKMAPFCVHDCFHTHFRWGNFLKDLMPELPKSNKGFIGRIPYGGSDPSHANGDGRPLVPSDQTVKIGLTGSSTFRYFAKTTPGFGWGSVYAGTWTVFNHHGSGYALGVASQIKWQGAGAGVAAHVFGAAEPYSDGGLITNLNPITSTPAFYFRLRWTGYVVGGWVERLQILDLSNTTGVRS
jgi:hypothetical protein